MTDTIDKMSFDDYVNTLSDSSYSIQLNNGSETCIMSERCSIPRILISEFLGTMIRVLFETGSFHVSNV